MILVLVSLIAVFLAGTTCGIFAMVVIGIHAEERRTTRSGNGRTLSGTASRRLLSTQTGDDLPARLTARK